MMKKNNLYLLFLQVFIILFSFSHHAYALTADYEYDDQYRLTKVTRSNGTTVVYNYDEAGNRTQMIVNSSAAAPVAAFTANPVTGNVPMTVNFTDQSTGNIASWSWNFGDGSTITAQNPTHTYQNEGTYTVSLTVSGPSGSDTKTIANLVAVTASGSCTYSLSPASASFPPTAASSFFSVTTSGGSCSWTAISGAAWITITSGGSGTGAGTVVYSVSENTGPATRTGTITVGSQTLTVTQLSSSTSNQPTLVASGGGYGGQTPKMTRTNSALFVLNTDSDRYLKLYKSTDDGASFNGGMFISTTSKVFNDVQEFAMCSNQTDRVYVFWKDASTRKLNYAVVSGETGDIIQQPASLFTSFESVSQPHCTVEGSNTYILFRGYDSIIRELYYAMSQDGGVTFISPVRVTNNTIQEDYGIVSVHNGAIYVAYLFLDINNSSYNLFLTQSTNGTTFSSPIRVNKTDGKTDYGHDMKIASNGKLFVAHRDTTTDGWGDLAVAESIDGGNTFSYVYPSGSTYREQSFPVLGISDNLQFIAWSDERNDFDYDAYLAYSNDSGATFNPETNLTPVSADQKPRSIVVASNQAYIAIVDYTESPVYKTYLYKYQAPSTCTYSLDPQGQAFTSSGGDAGLAIVASSTECTNEWTVSTTDNWITINSSLSGSGPATVSYSVAPSTNASPRTGAITVAGQTFTVTQEGVLQYELVLTTDGTGSGTVSGGGSYPSGAQVSITAMPDSGSVFSGWSGDCSGTENPLSFLMDSPKACAATFTLAAFDLTVIMSGSGSGTVSPSSGTIAWTGNTGIGTYAAGTQVTLTASAGAGASFNGWSGACAGTGSCVVTMNAAQTVTAVFSLLQTFSVTAAAGPGGGGNITPANTLVEAGASIILTIVPNSGYILSGLTDNGAQVSAVPGPSGTFTYTISSVAINHEVVATFAESANWAQVIIQPGPEGKDTFYGTVYTTGGSPNDYQLGYGGWGDAYYDFIEFDIANAPAANLVISAKLYLYTPSAPPSDPGLTVNRITQSWTEAGVTKTSNPTSTYYTAMTPITTGWNAVDITSLYKDWKNNVYPNYGIKLAPQQTWNTNSIFYSSDYTENPALRPMLVIETIVPGNHAYRLRDVPGSTINYLFGISAGNVVGTCFNGSKLTGFVDNNTNFTAIDVPGSSGTYAIGIDGNKVVGYYMLDNGSSTDYHGYVYDNGTYTIFDAPGASNLTQIYGVSGNSIAGMYFDGSRLAGFVHDGTNFTVITVPGSDTTFVQGIDGNKVVGYYIADGSTDYHGFIYHGGTYTTLDVPSAAGVTYLYGVDGDSIVGSYFDGSRFCGVVYDGAQFTRLDVPGSNGTFAQGIYGTKVVGYYMINTGSSTEYHGFVATPLAVPVSGDFTGDSDVDGSDLVALIADPGLLDIATFAANFGRTGNQ